MNELPVICLQTVACKVGVKTFDDNRSNGYQLRIEDISDPCGMFVTFYTKGKLRGCIGTVRPVALNLANLHEYAHLAAFHDRRFEKIKANDLVDLSCSVTLLYDYEIVNNVKDVVLGIHGICVTFTKNASAVFLPHVIEENEWDHDGLLMQLRKKANVPPHDKITKMEIFKGIQSDVIEYASIT